MFVFPERKVSEQHLTLDMALRFTRDEPRRLSSSFGNEKSPIKAEMGGLKESGRKHAQIRSLGITQLDLRTHPLFLYMPTLRALPILRTRVHVETSATSSPKPEAQSLAELGQILRNPLYLANATFCFACFNFPWSSGLQDRSGHGTQGSNTC